MFRSALVLGVALAVGSWGLAQTPGEQKLPEKAEKAKKVVAEHVANLKSKNMPNLVWIGDETLDRTFPDYVFFAVRYRIYPVAMQLPEGMKASNLFAVKGDKLEHIKDAKALEAFFKANAPAVTKAETAKDAVSSWLSLAQEFIQDGFYKFDILTKEIDVTEKVGQDAGKAKGRAVVMKGGNGEISVVLDLDKAGKVTGVADKTEVKQGPRPICQATKLLDADPVVRKMAEQDLLFMGLAARDYLMEQRASASPELRQAIDQLWERIVKNGW
jgi:hypothetical protein